jgi:hypothetical protein
MSSLPNGNAAALLNVHLEGPVTRRYAAALEESTGFCPYSVVLCRLRAHYWRIPRRTVEARDNYSAWASPITGIEDTPAALRRGGAGRSGCRRPGRGRRARRRGCSSRSSRRAIAPYLGERGWGRVAPTIARSSLARPSFAPQLIPLNDRSISQIGRVVAPVGMLRCTCRQSADAIVPEQQITSIRDRRVSRWHMGCVSGPDKNASRSGIKGGSKEVFLWGTLSSTFSRC